MEEESNLEQSLEEAEKALKEVLPSLPERVKQKARLTKQALDDHLGIDLFCASENRPKRSQTNDVYLAKSIIYFYQEAGNYRADSAEAEYCIKIGKKLEKAVNKSRASIIYELRKEVKKVWRDTTQINDSQILVETDRYKGNEVREMLVKLIKTDDSEKLKGLGLNLSGYAKFFYERKYKIAENLIELLKKMSEKVEQRTLEEAEALLKILR